MTVVLNIDDEYNFGVNNDDQSVKFVKTDVGKIALNKGDIENPFFVGIGSNVLSRMDYKELYTQYKKTYVLCMKDNYDMDSMDSIYKIFDRVINKKTFANILGQFSLIQGTMSLLRNNHYKNNGCIVDGELMKKYFGEEYEFDINEIVIPMFELTESVAKTNMKLYDKQYDVENMKDVIDLTTFYNKSYKKPVIDQLIAQFGEMQESQFWSQQRNCNINMTNAFLARTFSYNSNLIENTMSENNMNFGKNIKDDNVEQVIKHLMAEKFVPKPDQIEYMNVPVNNNDDKFIDAFTALKSTDKRTYFISSNELKLTEEEMVKMLCSINDETELYHAFNALVVSKDYCHMVLNNKNMLTKVMPLFDKFGPIYKYLLGYAWACFIIEESIMKTKTTKDSRYVYDIDTANKLPTFPFIFSDIGQNPYLSMFVDKTWLNPNENITGLYCIEDFDGYGVCTLEQFKWRLNLFISGNGELDIFKGIDWKSFAISGSAMSACLQKKSPLFDTVASKDIPVEDQWLTFFDHYYGESDVDMMCNDPSIFDFTTKVQTVIDIIKTNTNNAKINVVDIKSMVMCVGEHFFTECLAEFNESYSLEYTAEEFKANLESAEVKEYLYDKYRDHKKKANHKIKADKKDLNQAIKNFMRYTTQQDMGIHIMNYTSLKNDKQYDSDMCFYINDFRDATHKVADKDNFLVMKIGENIKFKIKSEKMTKGVELFRSKTEDFFGVVSRFHLPCVRAYYQGDNVYMLPSCITAMMTGINIDYKYFAGIRDPIDIINKYCMRGFGIFLSQAERQHMLYYNTHVNTHGGMFHIEPNSKALWGGKELTNKMYTPLIFTRGLPKDIYYSNKNIKYIKNIDQLKQAYKTKYGYSNEVFGLDVFKLKTIMDNGSIMPYAQWAMKGFLELQHSNPVANQKASQFFKKKMAVPLKEQANNLEEEINELAKNFEQGKPTYSKKKSVHSDDSDSPPMKKKQPINSISSDEVPKKKLKKF